MQGETEVETTPIKNICEHLDNPIKKNHMMYCRESYKLNKANFVNIFSHRILPKRT